MEIKIIDSVNVGGEILVNLARDGNLEGIKKVIDLSETNLNSQDPDGNTVLMRVVLFNVAGAIPLAKEKPNLVINVDLLLGRHGLADDIANEPTEVIIEKLSLLIKNNAKCEESIDDCTVAIREIVSAEARKLDVVKYLLYRISKSVKENVFTKNKYGFTALMMAAINGNPKIIECLLQYYDTNRKAVEEKNIFGDTALALAKRYGHQEAIRILTEFAKGE